MLIRAAEYSTCVTCGTRKRVKGEAHGCDQCRKVIDFERPNVVFHEIVVFRDADANTRHIFCSVRCVVAWLRAFKPPKGYRFMSLPLFSGRAALREVQAHLK